MPEQSAFDKEKKRKIKTELEDLLSQYGNGERIEDDVVNSQLQEIVAAPPIDFEEMNATFLRRAKEITSSVFDFYLTLGILDEHEYLKQKKALDESNIQNIFFQVKTIKFAIEKIMQEINAGSTHPRLFEVLGQLQDKLSNAVKTQANYVLFLEDSYKKMRIDIENKANLSGDGPSRLGISAPKKDEYFVTAGTKNMIKALEGQPVVAEFIQDGTNNLTDPVEKDDLMETQGLSHLKKKDNLDEDDYSDSIDEMI